MNAIATITTPDFAADLANLRADLVRAHELANMIRTSSINRPVRLTLQFVCVGLAKAFAGTFAGPTSVVAQGETDPVANYSTEGADLEKLHSLIEVSMEAAHWLTIDAGMSTDTTEELQAALRRTKRALSEHDAAR
jgi:hypothetical protein